MQNVQSLKLLNSHPSRQELPHAANKINNTEFERLILVEVQNLQTRVSKLLLESDKDTIKFCSLGFRTSGDADAWRANSEQYGS